LIGPSAALPTAESGVISVSTFQVLLRSSAGFFGATESFKTRGRIPLLIAGVGYLNIAADSRTELTEGWADVLEDLAWSAPRAATEGMPNNTAEGSSKDRLSWARSEQAAAHAIGKISVVQRSFAIAHALGP
jgi:hypothetical protein